jgi:tetratricopeptide (TPR) repeat protein
VELTSIIPSTQGDKGDPRKTLSPSRVVHVEEVCDRFEAAWKAGERPRIEGYLGGTSEPERSALLRELILVEVAYRRRVGDDPRPEDYHAHFPVHDLGWLASAVTPNGPHDPTLGQAGGGQGQVLAVTTLSEVPPQSSCAANAGVLSLGGAVLTGLDVVGYEILGELGRGGMGVVYKARHQQLNRLVALKMVRAGTQARPDQLARFRFEAEAVARLRHAHIVQIYDIGEVSGLPFVSLELLEGGTLAGRLAGTPQPARPAAELVATLARAMHGAHQAGIMHRDLKPSNVLFDRDGTPKIADFGLAKRLEQKEGPTETGQIVGTPSYMAPEQARGQTRKVGPAADVYALGAILYEMLTGRPPFKAPTPLETARQVVEEEPVSPSRLQSKVPRDLETICLKCLAKEPPKRYADAAALAADLDRYLAGEPIRARRTPVWERGLKWARRRPTAATLLALGVVAVVSAVAVVAEWSRRDLRQLATLRRESVDDLLKAWDALEQQDWNKGQSILSRRKARIEGESRLADLFARASELSAQIDRTLADQARYRRFIELRDEAFYRDTEFTGLDGPGNLKTTRDSARAALAVFAADDRYDALAPGRRPSALSPKEWATVAEDCYELLLVLAEAVAQPRPEEDHRQQADEGLRILDRAAKLRDPSRAYHLRRAACLKIGGDEEGADRERQEADRLPPASAFDHFLSGQAWSKRRKWAAAIEHFEAALRRQPDHFWTQCLLAIGYLQTQRPTEARLTLTFCLRSRPGLVWLYLLRGHAFAVEGQFKQIQAKLTPAAAKTLEAEAKARFADAEADFCGASDLPLNGEDRYTLLINRGTVRLLQRQFPAAITDLEEAIKIRPGQFQAYATLAQVFQQQGQLGEAVALFNRAIDQKQDWAPLYRGRANVYLERKDPAQALRDMKEAIRREVPGSRVLAGDHTQCAELLYRSRRFEEALDACDAALAIVPDYAEAHLWRIRALLELKRFDEVIDSCDVCLATRKPSTDLYELRGLAREGRDDFFGAIEDYRQSLALRPGTARVLVRLGWAYLFANAPKLALSDFEEALGRDPENPDAYNGRGAARVLLGKHREAVADAEEALRHGEPTHRVLYGAARTYAQAALVATTEVNRRGLAALSLCSRYEDRALVLLRRAFERLPAAQRAAFWRDVIKTDPALRGLRRRSKFAALALLFAPSPR